VTGRNQRHWQPCGIQATVDSAGRLVIPKSLREQIGLHPGVVDITIEGAALRIEPRAGDDLEERNGRPLVPQSGVTIDDELVRGSPNADQP
jgi:AbrB family looped-hinge helix DNA binding protein